MNLVQKNIDSIQGLCEKHFVKNLFVFGSILTEDFKNKSDIDFVVAFNHIDLYKYADNYFSLKDELEKLLKRPIDLLENQAIKNPFLLDSINNTKDLVYG